MVTLLAGASYPVGAVLGGWLLRSTPPGLVAAPAMLLGYKISDVPSIMGVMDMCIGETDR